MATSFSIYDYGATYVDLYIKNDHAYTRVFIRTSDSSWSWDSGKFETEDSDFYYPLDNLDPDTDYIVNVGWSDENTTGKVTWIGAKSFTTESDDEPPLTQPLFSVEADIASKKVTAYVDDNADYSYFKYSLYYIDNQGKSVLIESTDYIIAEEYTFNTTIDLSKQYVVWFGWSNSTTGVGNAYGIHVALTQPYITVVSVGTSSIKVRVDNLNENYTQGIRVAFWEFEPVDGGKVHEGDVNIDVGVSSGGTYTATGLLPDTEYEIRCEIGYDVDGTGNYAFTTLSKEYVTTEEGDPEFTLVYYSFEEQHGPVHVGDLDELLVIANNGDPIPINRWEMHCFSCSFDKDCTIAFYSVSEEKDLDMDGYISTEIDFDVKNGEATKTEEYAIGHNGAKKYDSSANDYDFSMVFEAKANQVYYFWWSIVPVEAIDGTAIFYIKKYEGSATIEPWSWDWKNDGQASAKETISARDALRNHGPITDFSYKVWNDLISKTKEARGMWRTDDGKYLTDSDLKYSSYDNPKILTADMFNSLKYNIEYGGYSVGFADVKKGDPVKGSYFFALTNKLNEYIDDISAK